tara:strand:+ start:141 stop:386 length:246 start_codon:yes stop_codon:yes gene_type:complete
MGNVIVVGQRKKGKLHSQIQYIRSLHYGTSLKKKRPAPVATGTGLKPRKPTPKLSWKDFTLGNPNRLRQPPLLKGLHLWQL